MSLINNFNSTKSNFNNTQTLVDKNINNKIKYSCDKWIVLTTETLPTDQVKYLRDTSFDWCILVVADLKTPIDWQYKDIYFLDLNSQNILAEKIKIIKKIPFNSYLRKMIGYLFVIEKNAKFIFETNDKTDIIDGLNGFRYENFSGVETLSDKLLISPSLYFSSIEYNQFTYSNKIPLIQNSVSNEENFDSNKPPLVLKKNQYSTYSSINTLFHYDSFWSLIFPLDISTDRDTIRSIISIRLLKEIDAHLAFMPPNNLNSYNNTDNIFKYENIILLLNKWKCSKNSLDECLIDCVKYLVNESIFDQKEIEFYQDWVQDLKNLGYKFPVIKTKTTDEEELKKILFLNSNKSSNINNINQFCNLKLTSIKPCKINHILITQATNAQDIYLIESTLMLHFSYIIVCFNSNFLKDQSNLNLIVILNINSFNECLERATNLGFKLQSFIISSNFKKITFWNVNKIRFSKKSFNSTKQLRSNEIYFYRKNIANGIRKLKIKEKNFNSLCSVYKLSKENEICDNLLKEINSLNWHSNDLAAEYCSNLDSKTIWIPDYHDGPRVDLSSTLIHLGQYPILAGLKRFKSPYPNSLRLSKISNKLSKLIFKHKSITDRSLDEELIKSNFNYYKRVDQFKRVNAVICSFPASICEAFIPLNKTIILNPAHRYNLIRCSLKQWVKLNSNLNMLNSKSKLILSSMSRYDREYTFHYTGLKGFRLYAFGGFYSKKIKYNPIRKEILVGPANGIGASGNIMLNELNEYARNVSSEYIFAKIRKIYSKYTLDQLANHRAIVLFPYAVQTYSVNDFYISNIPLFIPSIEMLVKWKNFNDRTSQHYCGNDIEILNAFKNTYHTYDPNSNSDESVKYWLQFADYYQLPFVTVFDSWQDLINKLDKTNFNKISEEMRRFNKIKETDLLNNWCKILKKLNESPIPNNYNSALEYFNTSRFQVKI